VLTLILANAYQYCYMRLRWVRYIGNSQYYEYMSVSQCCAWQFHLLKCFELSGICECHITNLDVLMCLLTLGEIKLNSSLLLLLLLYLPKNKGPPHFIEPILTSRWVRAPSLRYITCALLYLNHWTVPSSIAAYLCAQQLCQEQLPYERGIG